MSELVVMSGTKSVVWDNFGLECRTDGKVVKDSSTTCQTCRKRVLAKHGNTSNLLAHLKMSHPSIYAEAKSAMDTKGKRPAQDSVPVPAPAATQLTLVQSMTASQKERKMEGAHCRYDLLHSQILPSNLHSGDKWISAHAEHIWCKVRGA